MQNRELHQLHAVNSQIIIGIQILSNRHVTLKVYQDREGLMLLEWKKV